MLVQRRSQNSLFLWTEALKGETIKKRAFCYCQNNLKSHRSRCPKKRYVEKDQKGGAGYAAGGGKEFP